MNSAWVSCCFQLSFCIIGCQFYGTLSLTGGIEIKKKEELGRMGEAKAPPPAASLPLFKIKQEPLMLL